MPLLPYAAIDALPTLPLFFDTPLLMMPLL